MLILNIKTTFNSLLTKKTINKLVSDNKLKAKLTRKYLRNLAKK